MVNGSPPSSADTSSTLEPAAFTTCPARIDSCVVRHDAVGAAGADEGGAGQGQDASSPLRSAST
jgi:hypothetical protein